MKTTAQETCSVASAASVRPDDHELACSPTLYLEKRVPLKFRRFWWRKIFYWDSCDKFTLHREEFSRKLPAFFIMYYFYRWLKKRKHGNKYLDTQIKSSDNYLKFYSQVFRMPLSTFSDTFEHKTTFQGISTFQNIIKSSKGAWTRYKYFVPFSHLKRKEKICPFITQI